MLEAFAKTAADPDFPPVGVIVFVGQRSFDGLTPMTRWRVGVI